MEVDGCREEHIIQPVVGGDRKNAREMILATIPLPCLLLSRSGDGTFRAGRSKSGGDPHKIEYSSRHCRNPAVSLSRDIHRRSCLISPLKQDAQQKTPENRPLRQEGNGDRQAGIERLGGCSAEKSESAGQAPGEIEFREPVYTINKNKSRETSGSDL